MGLHALMGLRPLYHFKFSIAGYFVCSVENNSSKVNFFLYVWELLGGGVGWVGRINSNKWRTGWTPFFQGIRKESIPGDELI
jgi:hypothetical protein